MSAAALDIGSAIMAMRQRMPYAPGIDATARDEIHSAVALEVLEAIADGRLAARPEEVQAAMFARMRWRIIDARQPPRTIPFPTLVDVHGDTDEWEPLAPDELEGRLEFKDLLAGIAALPRRQREAIVLHANGVHHTTLAHSTLTRAIARLRLFLAGETTPEEWKQWGGHRSAAI